MPSWKCKQAKRRRLKTERRAAVVREQLRTNRRYASMFITFIDYFLTFLRPLEVRALMCLSRESGSRHWNNLLNHYMRFYYHQECNRLFGSEWNRSWFAPVRTKLAAVLNRVCVCGAVTDQFDFLSKQRLCVECAREVGNEVGSTCSLTTPLFYDEEVFASVNLWTEDPVALLESIPTGKRVEVDGSIVADYDSIVLENAIWISGTKKSRLRMGSFALVIRASVYITDLYISSGISSGISRDNHCASDWRRGAHPAVQVLPPRHEHPTVRISDCLISNRAGAGILVLGAHVQLLKNQFRRCGCSAIICNGGTVEALHNRFRRLSRCENHRPRRR